MNEFKEVRFDEYCSKCQYFSLLEFEHPCCKCLCISARVDSHKPEFFVAATSGKSTMKAKRKK